MRCLGPARLHLVGFLDDYSQFVVGYGLHASASGAMVREVLEAAIANFGAPEQVLTDNGSQYKTWRGTSAFTRLLERRGIRQIVAAPRHPQTVGLCRRLHKPSYADFRIMRPLRPQSTLMGLFGSASLVGVNTRSA